MELNIKYISLLAWELACARLVPKSIFGLEEQRCAAFTVINAVVFFGDQKSSSKNPSMLAKRL